MTKPHFTFWLIAGIGLLWNLGGCMNYIMQTNPDNVAEMPKLYQLIIVTRPAWATAAFAIAVFGGAVGCILLLLRKQIAVQVLTISFVGVAVTAIDTVTRVGSAPSIMLSVLVGAALLWYASIAKRKEWLA